jgi:hypothetical protein
MSDSSKSKDSEAALATDDAPSVDRARRRLLALGVYVAPAILGIVALQQAGCQPSPSCQPAQCQPNTEPCQPDLNPCAPNTGCNPDTCPPNT